MQMPIYAHVKEVVDPQGRRAAIEINYMKFLAYNGSYKVKLIHLLLTSPSHCFMFFAFGG